MSVLLYDDETIEDLQLDGLRLIQKKNAFRFGMDSVLLAHFADIRENTVVADFGTGNGILILLLKGRKKGNFYYAIDIQEEAVELAARNINLNNMEECVRIIHADVINAKEYTGVCTCDAVICNPPYGHSDATLTSPYRNIAKARTQDAETLNHFLKGAYLILKGKGRIFLVYPAQHMLYLMKKLQEHHLEPKRFRLVYPSVDKPANLVLIEAVKDAKPTLHPQPPLIIYEKDRSLTNELKSIYHI